MSREKKFDGRCMRGVRADSKKGLTENAIAKKRSLSLYFVKKILEGSGETQKPKKRVKIEKVDRRRGKRPKFNRKQELDICRDYLDQRSAVHTAKKFGTTNQTVLKIIKTYGIITRKLPTTRKQRTVADPCGEGATCATTCHVEDATNDANALESGLD